MCIHSRLYLMIDRPHRQHVLELTEPPFDVAQVLVDRHHLEHAQNPTRWSQSHIYPRSPSRSPGSRSHPESGCILNRLPRNPRYFSVNSWMIVNISYDRYLSSRTVVDFGSCEVFSMVFV